MMIGFIEQTCITALRPYLTDDQRTVGTHVDVSHTAATPKGMQVVAEVVLTAVAGRTLQFDVACYDAAGLIVSGTHRRAIVDHTTFLQRVAARSEQPIWSLIWDGYCRFPVGSGGG
jgi:fluoroacetyl-CoA thioesterase